MLGESRDRRVQQAFPRRLPCGAALSVSLLVRRPCSVPFQTFVHIGQATDARPRWSQPGRSSVAWMVARRPSEVAVAELVDRS